MASINPNYSSMVFDVNNLNNQRNAINTSKHTKIEEKKDGKKMLAIGAAAAATIAIAGIAIYKGKGLGKNVKLQDIKFEKGIAKKGDKLFTGIVKDKLKNGDKVTLEYVDGVIKHSTRSGQRNFEKAFQTNEAGHKIVKTFENGKEKIFDITQRQIDVKKEQAKLEALLKDKTLSSKELAKKAGEIKYKSVNNQKEIDGLIDQKRNDEFLYQLKNKDRKDIVYKKGVPYYNGKKFNGTVHCTLENGDKVAIEYDFWGKPVKSTRTGSKNIIKEYNNAFDTVKITENGEVRNVNLFDKKQARFAEVENKKMIDYFNDLKTNAIQESEEFAKNLKDKSDEELMASLNDISEQLNSLTSPIENYDLRYYSDVKPFDINCAKLDEAGKKKYFSLNEKRNKILKEQSSRDIEYANSRKKHVSSIIAKADDKPVKTKHCVEYLNNDERDAFSTYIDDYTCNHYARKGKNIREAIDVDSMDSAFKKAPELTDDAIVYRAVHQFGKEKYIESFKDGVILANPGYTSTSVKPDTDQFLQFAGGVAEKSNDGVLMRIHLPKGTKGLLGGFDEFLLNRDSKIKVVKMNLINGVKVADCEYILP